MREHILKTWPAPFDALLDGSKTFELRKDDRAYAVGDVLVLKEYDPGKPCPHWAGHEDCKYSGREIRKVVTYRCSVVEWTKEAHGWVVLGLGDIPDPERKTAAERVRAQDLAAFAFNTAMQRFKIEPDAGARSRWLDDMVDEFETQITDAMAAAREEGRREGIEAAAECCEMRSFAEQDAGPLRAAMKRIRALLAPSAAKDGGR